MTMPATLYERIGAEFIKTALTEFYQRAFADMIIGHLFMGRDIQHLIEQQTLFATAMLGGPRNYRGKPVGAVHRPLQLRPPHFGRRQVILATVLTEMGLDEELRNAWLALEEGLRPMILGRG